MATEVWRKRKLTCCRSSIGKLGDDLIIEILNRLPDPGSAFRCKSICKRWNSLISTPYFSRRFLAHQSAAAKESEPPVRTLSQVRESILSFLPFPHETQSQFSILDSNKDLLLLGFLGRENDDELDRTYLVCNPFTKRWVALPLRPQRSARRGRWSPSIVKIVCEPCNSNGLDLGHGEVFNCHFGFSGFRVVRMYDLVSASWQVEVFCSRSAEWTNFVLRPHADSRCCISDRVVSANGKLYWLNRRSGVVLWDPFCNASLPTLIGGYIEFKCCLDGPWASAGGALHIICTERGDSVDLSVWRLEEERKGGWRKQYGVTSLKNVRFNGRILDGCKTEALEWEFQSVIGLHPEKSEIVFFMGFLPLCQQHAILSWNFRNEELEFLSYQEEEFWSLPYEVEKLFHPCITFWPSPIPGYKKLRNTYNGSYSCWQ